MEPGNFSEVIAQTDIKMQRLGWTTDQGSKHLKKTMGSDRVVCSPIKNSRNSRNSCYLSQIC
ncbi:MAG: hypothetical protein RMY36_033420 [Nostoc sp. SerVER01]